jgi:hypothetical protein
MLRPSVDLTIWMVPIAFVPIAFVPIAFVPIAFVPIAFCVPITFVPISFHAISDIFSFGGNDQKSGMSITLGNCIMNSAAFIPQFVPHAVATNKSAVGIQNADRVTKHVNTVQATIIVGCWLSQEFQQFRSSGHTDKWCTNSKSTNWIVCTQHLIVRSWLTSSVMFSSPKERVVVWPLCHWLNCPS